MIFHVKHRLANLFHSVCLTFSGFGAHQRNPSCTLLLGKAVCWSQQPGSILGTIRILLILRNGIAVGSGGGGEQPQVST
eukprot:2324719-Amphidinium_carterae.1